MSEPKQLIQRASPKESLAKVKAWHTSRLQSIIGTQMPDGSIFAGTLPDGKKLYVMPKNESIAMTFNDAAAHIGRVNESKRLSRNDWHLPTREELDLLWENRNKGALKGTFKMSNLMQELTDGDYWSSTPAPSTTRTIPVIHIRNFNYGTTGRNSTGCNGVVRLVR